MNVELLCKVRDHILAEPRRLAMDYWKVACSEETCPCGTIGCIAGWSLILSGVPDHEVSDAHSQAAHALGLTYQEAYPLFYLYRWPAKLVEGYLYGDSALARAKAAADAFITEREKIEEAKKLERSVT